MNTAANDVSKSGLEEQVDKLRSRAVFYSFLGTFIDSIGFGLILPVMAYIAEEFDASALMVGLLFTSFAAAMTICIPFWGAASDKVGRRPVVLCLMIGSSITYFMQDHYDSGLLSLRYAGVMGCGAAEATALCVVSQQRVSTSYPLLLISRALGGVFAGTATVSAAVIGDLFTGVDTAVMQGKLGALQGIAFVIGPLLGAVSSSISNSAPFFLAAIFALFSFLFAAHGLLETNKRVKPFWITPKSRHFFLKVAQMEENSQCQLKEVSTEQDAADTNDETKEANNEAEVPSAQEDVKVTVEQDETKPPQEKDNVPWVKEGQKISMILCFITGFCIMLMFSLLNVVLPLYLDDKWGLGAMAVGLFIAINSFTFAVCQTFLVKPVLAKLGLIKTGVMGTLLQCTFGFIFLWPEFWMMLVHMQFVYIGCALTIPVIIQILISISTDEKRGAVLGAYTSVAVSSMIVGPIIFGITYDVATFLPFVVDGFFFVLATVCVIILSFKVPKPQPPPMPEAGEEVENTKAEDQNDTAV